MQHKLSICSLSSFSSDSDEEFENQYYPVPSIPNGTSYNPFPSQTSLTEDEFLKNLLEQQMESRQLEQFEQVQLPPIPAKAETPKRLFVGDLSFFCTEKELSPLFAQFGPVVSVAIRRGTSGESLQYAFVTYDSKESALAAMAALNGKEFLGRKLRYIILFIYPFI